MLFEVRLKNSNMESSTDASSDEYVTSGKSKPFVCTYTDCKAAFTKNRKLTNHIRKHTGERPYTCDEINCDKSYTNSSHLRRHKKVYHEKSSNERVTCSIEGCHKEFAYKWCLKKHINRFHNPERKYPFMCTECKKGFHKKKQLQAHSFLHTGELPFSCNECSKKFASTKECSRHKRTHMNHQCKCGEVFDKWTKLLSHRKECDRKNLQCTVCDKTFSSKGNLNAHINIHVDKEDKEVYICPYDNCERYYFYKRNLQVHIKILHERTPMPKIPCKYDGCKKLFSKMQNYKLHLLRHTEPKKEKAKRKARKDKGCYKKSVLSELCGISLPLNIEKVNNYENVSSNLTGNVTAQG